MQCVVVHDRLCGEWDVNDGAALFYFWQTVGAAASRAMMKERRLLFGLTSCILVQSVRWKFRFDPRTVIKNSD
jgi:hypothetical protein